MKDPRRPRARWAAAAALLLALTGCGAGQNAATGEMKPAISGVDADAGDLALRDLAVDFGESGSYPAGGAAPLRVWIANDGETAVVLESVTSPIAEAVTLATDEAAGERPAGADANDASASPTESPEGAGAGPAGEREFAVEIGPNSYTRLSPKVGSFLLLEGLKEDVSMGSTVEVAFAFSNGETVTVHLPVAMPEAVESRSYYEEGHE